MLDLQSITRASRVSRRGKCIVQSLPAYRDLMKHAPDALAALSKTKLIHLHSAAQLSAALRSGSCATCQEYGAYLLLPTCERCCWECLQSNPTRRVVTPTRAGKAFALSRKKVQQLPVMFSIPGNYNIGQELSEKSHKLVSVSAVRELAMLIHGSAENLANITSRRKYDAQTATMAKHLQGVFFDHTARDPLMVPSQGNGGVDLFFGMASIPFPSLATPSILEHGLWCKGCERMFEQYNISREDTHAISRIVPPNRWPWAVLLGMARRARSRAGLLEHIEHCSGARQLRVEFSAER